MKRLLLLTLLTCAGSWVSGQSIQLEVDTLREWYAIKLTTEDILDTRTTLWRARAHEATLLREAIALKDQQITTLEQMNTSYSKSLSKSQGEATKYEAQAKRRGRTIWTLAVLFVGSVTLHLAR